MAEKIDDKGFFQRWSARKLDARAEDAAENSAANQPSTPLADPDAPPDLPPADLPDVETLDAESDFTAFLGENVPQDLAKMALRKLWRSDPVLANIDGLNDYDEDFSKVGMVAEAVKTVYQAGKGYLSEDDESQDADLLAPKDGKTAQDLKADLEADLAADAEPAPTEERDDGPSNAGPNAGEDAVLEKGDGKPEFHNAERVKPA